MDRRCVIIAAGDLGDPEYLRDALDGYIICADGGLRHAGTLGVKPDLLVGDMDSVSGDIPMPDCEVITHSPIKDDTDLGLAIEAAIERGYRELVVLAGVGGRMDHSLANVQILAGAVQKGVKAAMLHSENTVYLLDGPAEMTVKKRPDTYVSLLAHSPSVEGVYLRGMKYPLHDAELCNTYPLGVSNECVEDWGEIRIGKGTLIVLESREKRR